MTTSATTTVVATTSTAKTDIVDETNGEELPQQYNSSTISHPQEYLNGLWEADPFYYNSGSFNGTRAGSDEGATKLVTHRGMLYRARVDDEYKCFLDKEGILKGFRVLR